MIFLPVVERELRVRARQSATYWLRSGVVLLALFICWSMYLASTVFSSGTPNGQPIFRGLAFLAELLALCGGLFTADCISRERREGTLGLLMLTDLKGWEVLLAKGTSIGLNLILVLAGFIPCLSIPLLLGGVTGREVILTVLAILVALAYSLALGLWVSAKGASEQAMRTAAGYLTAWTIVPLLPLWLSDFVGTPWFAAFSPLFPFCWTMMSPAGSLLIFACSILLLMLFTILYSRSANYRLASNWQESEAGSASPPVHQSRRQSLPLHDARHPIAWLIERLPNHRSAFRWAALLILLQMIGPFAVRIGGLSSVFLLQGFGFVVSITYTGLIAWAACRFLLEARHSRTLELLLITPTGAQDFIGGHWQALRRGIRLPLAVAFICLAFNAIFYLVAGWDDYFTIVQFSSFLISAVSIWIELVTICWVGMRFGVKSPRAVTAVVWTLLLVDVSSWLIYAVVVPLLNAILWRVLQIFAGSSTSMYLFVLVGTSLLIIAKNLLLCRWAKRALARPYCLAG